MIRVAIAVLASLAATSTLAAVKPCEELKAEIEAKTVSYTHLTLPTILLV